MATEKEIEELAVAEAIWMSNGGLACVFHNIKVHGVHEGNLQKQRCVANAIAAIAALDAHRAEKGGGIQLEPSKSTVVSELVERANKWLNAHNAQSPVGYTYSTVKLINDLRNALQSPQMVQSGAVSDIMWRPIETAPKDAKTYPMLFEGLAYWNGEKFSPEPLSRQKPTYWRLPTPPKETQPTEK